ncbi:MAG: SDR family NAD(P)-dependent oxidoreductase [Thermoflexales bacterium]|nr:SDR family NAD(P)-dependent oxidoreductase [Thermoflexales bacterium]
MVDSEPKALDASAAPVLVTGGNRGIGLATCHALARRGIPVLMATRDVARGETAASALRAALPGAKIDVLALDLGSQAGIRRTADKLIAEGPVPRALVNNAGAIGLGETITFTEDGFETAFGVNHLGHFALTLLLLPMLLTHAPVRVISVSSIRHMKGAAGPGARFDFDNLKGEKGYAPRMAYNNTKLANVWFAYGLHRRYASQGVLSIAACPGFVPETLGATRSGLSRFIYNRALRLIPGSRPARVSGEELAALAVDPRFETEGGTFWASGKRIPSSPESYDVALADRLWALSERLTGVTVPTA